PPPFTDPQSTSIYTLSLHDALPIYPTPLIKLFHHAITTKYSFRSILVYCRGHDCVYHIEIPCFRVMKHDQLNPLRFCYFAFKCPDRKSTRLNSSHVKISYAVFCLKK